MLKVSRAKNIALKFSRASCCGCGVCAGVCPAHAIVMAERNGVFLPVVDDDRCVSCKSCLRVCPGINTNTDELNKKVYGQLPLDVDIGNYETCYTAFSCDEILRREASSGGAVSELLRFLFDNNEITCAAVVRMKYGDIIKAESFLARNVNDVLVSKGSKYCPVHLSGIVRSLINSSDHAAVVCLPCQAIALRKAMQNLPILKERIKIIVTLFCNQCPSYHASDEWIRQAGLSTNQVSEIQYRGSGWPGVSHLVTNDRRTMKFFYTDLWSSILGNGFYTPLCCLHCTDFFGEFSDLSVGDAWLEKYKDEKLGASLIISSTKESDQILKRMVLLSKIELYECEATEMKAAFGKNLFLKKDIAIISGNSIIGFWSRFLSLLRYIKARIGYRNRFLPRIFQKCYNGIESLLFKHICSREIGGYFK